MAVEVWLWGWQLEHQLLYLAHTFLIIKEAVVPLVSRFAMWLSKPLLKCSTCFFSFPTIL